MGEQLPARDSRVKSRRRSWRLLAATLGVLIVVVSFLSGGLDLIDHARSALGQFQGLFAHAPARSAATTPGQWVVTPAGNMLEIAYGKNGSFPQYGVLDLASSYLRLNYSPGSGWGTSVVLLPSFWSASGCGSTGYCQGASVTASSRVQGAALALYVTGSIGGLDVALTVTLEAPENERIAARVAGSVTGGSATLDTAHRPWEAFKLVELSSMHVSNTQWDASSAVAGGDTYALPPSGWIIAPAVNATSLALVGGSSSWKLNAPTVAVTLDVPRIVTGWVTAASNPSDENVGYWAAATTVLTSWSYQIVVTKAA